MSDTRRRIVSLLTCSLLAASALADTGGVWRNRSPLNLARQEVGAARISGSVYVVGGLVTTPTFAATATVERYDIAGDAWTFVTPLPAPRDHLGVCAAGGMVYAIGGFAGDFAARSEVWRYDPTANAWTPRAPLPSARGGHWAVAHQSRIYVFGGVDAAGAVRRTTFVYDTVLDQWSQGADMPTAREHLMAEVVGSFVHVVGGRAGASTGAHERYDPVGNVWQSLPPLPTPRSAAATAFFDGQLVVMGGEVPMLFARNEVYDPVSNLWRTQEPMPVPRHGVAAVALDTGIFVPAGGTIQGLMPTAHADEFRPLPPDVTSYCHCSSVAPCANTANEAGCRNSTGAGAELTAIGEATVGADTLELVASALPPGTTVLFFQGTTQVNDGAGLPFQDGLRCAAGIVTRIGMHAAPTGTTSYPLPGDPPVSVRVAVPPGATRTYQAWYRNPAGPWGTGSNLTSALLVVW